MVPYEPPLPAVAIVAPAPATQALTLDALASRIAGKPVRVLCPPRSAFDADPVTVSVEGQLGARSLDGDAQRLAGTFTLPLDECAAVQGDVLGDPSGAGLPDRLGYVKDATATFAFFHEASHLAEYPAVPWADEHATDCHALAVMPGVLASIGVPSMRVQWFYAVGAAIHSLRTAPYAGPCP